MARTVAQIQKQMTDAIAADSVLSPLLTSTSKRAIWLLFTFVIAASIAIFEQILDIFTTNIEATVAAAAPSTGSWLQRQISLFQYSDTSPQVVQLINFAPVYPVVDATLRVITRSSITTDIANNVIVKVAIGNPPGAAGAPIVSALQSYLNIVGAEGISYTVRSNDADRIYIDAIIFYSGLYSSVIQANVIQAINNYLANLPFNGNLKISDIELAIRSVVGVTDVILQNIRARADTMVFADGIFLVLNNATIARLWPTQAGYIIAEDTVGQTFTDSLQFIPE